MFEIYFFVLLLAAAGERRVQGNMMGDISEASIIYCISHKYLEK